MLSAMEHGKSKTCQSIINLQMLTKTYWINCACKNLPHMVFDKVVEDGEGSAPHLFLLNNIFNSAKEKMFIFSKFRYYFDILQSIALVCEQVAFDYCWNTSLMKFRVVAETSALLLVFEASNTLSHSTSSTANVVLGFGIHIC